MISISSSFDASDDVRYSDSINDHDPAEDPEFELATSPGRTEPEINIFDRARRIYDRARTTQRVRSSHII